MEQQAAIIEDYYRVLKGLAPENNVGTRRSSGDYAPYVSQLKSAGPFKSPGVDWTRRPPSTIRPL